MLKRGDAIVNMCVGYPSHNEHLSETTRSCVNVPRLMPARSHGWFQRFWNAPLSARRGLFAAWLGWALDGFDVMLYALVLGTLIQDLSLSKPVAGLLGSLTLIASGFGGVL